MRVDDKELGYVKEQLGFNAYRECRELPIINAGS